MADHPDFFEIDGEEEPLFADDLDDLDDDVPPLPPPMPSLSQLSNSRTAHLRVNLNSQENFGGGTTAGGTGSRAGEEEEQEPQKKKRKPLLTLTADRIFSEKGLPYLEKEFPRLKFKGKGHEASDLKYLLQQYEHWANTLFPKLTFKDVTDKIESLASKKSFKSELDKMRRRSARGGISTPPLSDEEDQDTNGITENDGTSPQLGDEAGGANGSSGIGWGGPAHGRSDSNGGFATSAVDDRSDSDGGALSEEEDGELGNAGKDGGALSEEEDGELGNAGRDGGGASERVTLGDVRLSDLEEEDRNDGGTGERVTLGDVRLSDLEEEDRDNGGTGDRENLSSGGGSSEEGGELGNTSIKNDNLEERDRNGLYEEGSENPNAVRNRGGRLVDSDSDDDL